MTVLWKPARYESADLEHILLCVDDEVLQN